MNALYRKIISFFLFLFMTMLIGCAPVGPNYTPPQTSVSAKWYSQLKKGSVSESTDSESLSSWWTTFDDAQLSELLERAVTGNLDLKDAQSRVRQARANRGITKAGLFPTLDFSGSDKWTRSGEDGGTGKTTQLYSSSFDAGWEIDIFGGVRRFIEAAEADMQAVQEDLHDTLITLLAEVALNYVEVRTYQYRLATVQENLTAQNETYQLILWRSQAGLSDELAVQQARYNLESTRSQIPSLNTGLEEAMNRIAVLLGEQPGKINKELKESKSIPVAPPETAVGVPADMIRRRPDIRKAERELAAQTARIGVATAELYPKFKLAGSISASSVSFNRLANNLSSSGDLTLSGGPGISWAVFDAGAIRQNIKVQSELQEQALIKYESAILGAIEEVENVLTAYADEQDKNYNLQQAVDAAQSAVDLSKQEYQAGLIDFSNVLDAQRSLLSFQNELAQSDGTIASNFIRLYKALGGGWTSFVFEENNKQQKEKK
jgi:NodT family efflux transporter outer membrane factor (OMF) lipoprotein